MGMYTELVVSTSIEDNPEVINVLKLMIAEDLDVPEIKELPKHPLFETPRWNYMLRSASYYFTPAASSLLQYDKFSKNWSFINRSDFKNYDNEINLFLDWLDPYIDAVDGEMIGYSRYEESDEPEIRYKGKLDAQL
jgi:hypothetical protein